MLFTAVSCARRPSSKQREGNIGRETPCASSWETKWFALLCVRLASIVANETHCRVLLECVSGVHACVFVCVRVYCVRLCVWVWKCFLKTLPQKKTYCDTVSSAMMKLSLHCAFPSSTIQRMTPLWCHKGSDQVFCVSWKFFYSVQHKDFWNFAVFFFLLLVKKKVGSLRPPPLLSAPPTIGWELWAIRRFN